MTEQAAGWDEVVGYWVQNPCDECGAWLTEMPTRWERREIVITVGDPKCPQCLGDGVVSVGDDVDTRCACARDTVDATYDYIWVCLRCRAETVFDDPEPPDTWRPDPDAKLEEPGTLPPSGVRDPNAWTDASSLSDQQTTLVQLVVATLDAYHGGAPGGRGGDPWLLLDLQDAFEHQDVDRMTVEAFAYCESVGNTESALAHHLIAMDPKWGKTFVRLYGHEPVVSKPASAKRVPAKQTPPKTVTEKTVAEETAATQTGAGRANRVAPSAPAKPAPRRRKPIDPMDALGLRFQSDVDGDRFLIATRPEARRWRVTYRRNKRQSSELTPQSGRHFMSVTLPVAASDTIWAFGWGNKGALEITTAEGEPVLTIAMAT